MKNLGFMGSMGMGILCFSMAVAYLPVLIVAARKFALLYTLGSIFFISSFSFLYGPKKHFKESYSTFEIIHLELRVWFCPYFCSVIGYYSSGPIINFRLK